MGLLGRLARNAKWHGALSQAALGAGFGGVSAGLSGGDLGDIGRGAVLGGLGGAASATLGIPGSAGLGGSLSGMVGGLSQTMDDPEAQKRLQRHLASDVVREAASIGGGRVDQKSLIAAMDAQRVPEAWREQVFMYAAEEAQDVR